MLKPSYAELMDVLNQNSNESDEVTSRYTIVIAAAKRARQLIEGDESLVKNIPGKPVSTAVNEILNNKIKIVPEGEGTVLFFDKKENKNEYEVSFDGLNIEVANKPTDVVIDEDSDDNEDEDFDDIDDNIE